ncbi:MAG: DNA polymerase III subunit chi [Hyphomicrobiaceae bacterium]
MAEIWFYHLERQTLDEVLPNLLERTLERGWRAVVQAGSRERLEAIDNLLWTYSNASFLPHGMKRDGNPVLQPVFLTEDDDNPNGSDVRFLVEGAELVDPEGYTRLVYLFDGADPEALGRARAAWTQAKSTDCQATYWRQTEAGRWEKQQ